jgi:hypothetical protein
MELFLYTEESKYSINMSMWDVQSVSVEENKKRALNDLLVNRRYLLFITNDKQVHTSYDRFLEKPDKNEFENVLLAMRNDLWSMK